MQYVTFTKPMAPYSQGERIVVPDDVADRLVASGEAENPVPWPQPEIIRTDMEPAKRGPGHPPKSYYQTKG